MPLLLRRDFRVNPDRGRGLTCLLIPSDELDSAHVFHEAPPIAVSTVRQGTRHWWGACRRVGWGEGEETPRPHAWHPGSAPDAPPPPNPRANGLEGE